MRDEKDRENENLSDTKRRGRERARSINSVGLEKTRGGQCGVSKCRGSG